MTNDIKVPPKITADDLKPDIPEFCPDCRAKGKEVKLVTHSMGDGTSWFTECPSCGKLYDED